jgi:hypothetical protein
MVLVSQQLISQFFANKLIIKDIRNGMLLAILG